MRIPPIITRSVAPIVQPVVKNAQKTGHYAKGALAGVAALAAVNGLAAGTNGTAQDYNQTNNIPSSTSIMTTRASLLASTNLTDASSWKEVIPQDIIRTGWLKDRKTGKYYDEKKYNEEHVMQLVDNPEIRFTKYQKDGDTNRFEFVSGKQEPQRFTYIATDEFKNQPHIFFKMLVKDGNTLRPVSTKTQQ